MNTICKLSRTYIHSIPFCKGHPTSIVRHCTTLHHPSLTTLHHSSPQSPLTTHRHLSAQKEPEDFIEWQENIRKKTRDQATSRGLDRFDESVYDDKFKLVVTDDDAETIKEKMVEALLAAIELYKERQPRLRQDHPQFVQWCMSRMFQYEITDRIELYEVLFECFPRHMYVADGFIATMMPKPHPGLHAAVDLINLAHKSGLKPSYVLYRNVFRSFGKGHLVVTIVRRWGWWHYIFRKAHPYPLTDGTYNYSELATNHTELAEFVAERTMDQKCTFREIKNAVGEYIGTAVISDTQNNLSLLQTPDDVMRLSGPHSIWAGKVQRWYWVLRREERGDEFEGAPLGMVVSPYKEMSREAAQQWLEDSRTTFMGIGGSTIIFDNPDELLSIDPEAHFKERVALFSDGIDDVHIESSILPQLFDGKSHQNVKKLTKVKDAIRFKRDKDAYDKDDEW